MSRETKTNAVVKVGRDGGGRANVHFTPLNRSPHIVDGDEFGSGDETRSSHIVIDLVLFVVLSGLIVVWMFF